MLNGVGAIALCLHGKPCIPQTEGSWHAAACDPGLDKTLCLKT